MTSHLVKEDERYKIDSKVGTGAMATVFKAYDTRLQRTVALKILHDHLSSNAELKLRFEQEAKLAARIVHPNIVRTYDFGLNKNRQLFIVSEFVDGRSLTVAMREYKNQSQHVLHPILAALVALEISKGVEAAHQHSVIHRDLKPDNVLVSIQGEIKLTDFGVARPFDSSMTQVGQFIGSLTYASPEQIKGEPLDARSDIFSLGVMLFEILTGRLPFRSSNPTDLALKISRAEVEPLNQHCPTVPNELDQMVRQCLRADPNERPPNASSIVAQLESYLKSEKVIPSNSAISDGFLDPELFTSTIRRGPVLPVEKPIPQEPKTVSSPVAEPPARKPLKQSLNNSSKYRSHDPKKDSQRKPRLGTSATQRRYASLILTTASLTLIIVTLIVQERARIINLIRGNEEQHAHEDAHERTSVTQGESTEFSAGKSSPPPPPQLQQSPAAVPVQPNEFIPRQATHEGDRKQKKSSSTIKEVGKAPKLRNTKSQVKGKKPAKPSPREKKFANKASRKTQTPRLPRSSFAVSAPAEQKAATGQIVIRTQPAEMTIYINGVFEGLSSRQESGRTFTIPAGNVTLKIPAQENNGRLYREYIGRFRIEPGKVVTIPTINLSPTEDSSKGDR